MCVCNCSRAQVIKGFQEALPCAPVLSSLDVTAAGITDACAAGFRRLLECSASLRHLRLDRCRLNQAAMQVRVTRSSASGNQEIRRAG